MKNWQSALNVLETQDAKLREEQEKRQKFLNTPIVLLRDKESVEAINGIVQEIESFLSSADGQMLPRLLELGRLGVSFGSEERPIAGEKTKFSFSFGGQGWKRITHSSYGGSDKATPATTFEAVQRVYSEDKASANNILRRLIEAADSVANPSGRD